MGNFVNSNLIKDEKVIFEAEVYKPLAWICAVIVGLILAMFTFGIGLIAMLVYTHFELKNIELAITDKRIIAKHGVFGRHTFENKLNKSETIPVEQGFISRMLGMGSVIIVGTGGTREEIANIKDPFTFRNKFLEVSE